MEGFLVSERLLTMHEITPWIVPEEFQGIMGYNPRHDIQDYLDLKNLNGKLNPEDYLKLQIQTNTRTQRQLEKALGERFGVEKSTFEYFTDTNGRLRSPDYPEPVVQRYEKGRQFLEQNGSTETGREKADVESIENIEKVITNSNSLQNLTAIIVSAQGGKESLYTENFFDVWQKNAGRILVTRYHSTHSLEGFLQAAHRTDATFPSPESKNLTAAYFLNRPIVTSVAINAILQLFALDKNAQPYEINQEIIEACTPFVLSYIQTLIENPLDIEKIKLTINAIYNLADRTEEQIKKRQTQKALFLLKNAGVSKIPAMSAALYPLIYQQIEYLGRQPVRTVDLGCPGGQKGFSVSQRSLLRNISEIINAKSVIDFANLFDEDEEVVPFECPGKKSDGSKCHFIIQPYSHITKCPECGAEATCKQP